MSNPITNSLPTYVEQNRFELIGKSVLGAKTARLFGLQTGIKTSATINLLNTNITLQNGASCGFNAEGTQTITQRSIETGQIKVNMEYCPKNLLNTAFQSKVRGEQLPFEEKFTEEVVKAVQAKNEQGLWTANKESGDFYDGLLTIFAREGVNVITDASADDLLTALQRGIETLPAIAIKEDTAIMMGQDMFLKLVNQLVNKNLAHFNAENTDYEMVMPGTSIKIYGLAGLNGTNKIVLGRLENFKVGTDMEGDAEDFKLWYSDDADLWRLKINYNLGVNVAFLDEIVMISL
jgi:hypothetical protein